MASGGFLKDNQKPGMYSLLEDFTAFSDPLRKKSGVFIQLVAGADLLRIKDPEAIKPIMDYHMQRVLLRTGCIEVIDKELKSALQNKQQILSDADVRNAAVEAVRLLSKHTNKNFFELDEFLWSLGRSCCKEKTLCTDEVCNKNPCTFFSFVDIPEHKHCIFENVCKAHADESYGKLWQPIVDTHYY